MQAPAELWPIGPQEDLEGDKVRSVTQEFCFVFQTGSLVAFTVLNSDDLEFLGLCLYFHLQKC